MGTMTVGLVIAGIVVVAVVLLAMRWRSASSEQQALRHYQHALDTLRTVSDRMESSRPAVEPKSQLQAPDRDEVSAGAQSGAVAWEERHQRSETRVSSRTVPAPAQARRGASEVVRGAPGPSHAPVRASSRPSPPRLDEDPEATPAQGLARTERSPQPGLHTGSEPVLVFDEDAVGAEPAATSNGAYSGPTVTRASLRALQRSSRPASRVPVFLGVSVVVVAVAVLVVLAAGLGSHHTTTPTTLAHHHVTSPPHHSTTTQTSASTTTTTVVQTVQPEASTATTQGATYPAPSGRYTVMLTSTGDCWVYATLASTGAVLWTGDLVQGQAQALTGAGEIDVQLGHANTMTETLNGTPVEYPAQFQAVFTMKFVPSTT
jgi:hypothetical protein